MRPFQGGRQFSVIPTLLALGKNGNDAPSRLDSIGRRVDTSLLLVGDHPLFRPNIHIG